jgi:hypothetical protein
MTDYLSYDIELYDELPQENPDLKIIKPSVAATCTDFDDCYFYDDDPFMTIPTANLLVDSMLNYQDNGYKVLTWNGLSFDLQLLGYYSGRLEDCGKIALNHVDMMFLVVCHKGFFLGLDKALAGAKIETKIHSVELNDNTVFSEMNGSKAPLLWRNKEFSAVRTYLRGDVEQPLKLARHIETAGYIRWISNSGKLNSLKTDMLTVKEALKLPLPDTSWMSAPKPREEFYNWIPENILKQEL